MGPPGGIAPRTPRDLSKESPGIPSPGQGEPRRPGALQPVEFEDGDTGTFTQEEVAWAVQAWAIAARAKFGAKALPAAMGGGGKNAAAITACAEWLEQSIGARSGALRSPAEIHAACLGVGIGEPEAGRVAARMWTGLADGEQLPVGVLLQSLESDNVASVPRTASPLPQAPLPQAALKPQAAPPPISGAPPPPEVAPPPLEASAPRRAAPAQPSARGAGQGELLGDEGLIAAAVVGVAFITTHAMSSAAAAAVSQKAGGFAEAEASAGDPAGGGGSETLA